MRAAAIAISVFVVVGAPGGVADAGDHVAKPRVRPWLGISISDVDAAWGGVSVYDVFDDTPASLCGLRAGDEILSVDHVTVHGSGELQATVGGHAVGDRVSISYVRRGDVRRCSTRLAPQVTDPTELLQRRLVDKTVPPFVFARRGDATPFEDTSLRGHVVVLGLFTTMCDSCAATLTELADRLAADDGARGVTFTAVAAEGDQAVDAYVQRMGLSVDLASDKGDLVRHYLADRDDVTIVVIDHEGVVRFAASGPGPDDTHLDGAVYCATRAERARHKDE